MKSIYKLFWISVLVVIISGGLFLPQAYAEDETVGKTIPEWSIMWGDEPESVEGLVKDFPSEKWMTVTDPKSYPMNPEDVSSAWVRLKLPPTIPNHYALLIGEVFAQHLKVYIGSELVDETNYHFPKDVQRVFIPLSSKDAGKTIYLKMETTMERLGIHSEIKIDDFSISLREYVTQDLGSVILGFGFLFIALIMLICSILLKKNQIPIWISLSVVILAMGIIFITYSPFMTANFSEYGMLLHVLFDISLAVFLPTLSFFFEQVFEGGKLTIIRRFRKFQVVYSIFAILCTITNVAYDFKFYKSYFFFTVTILGCIMMVQFILLIGYSILHAVRGNKDAIILSCGFSIFSFMAIIDLIWFYLSSQTYQIFLWKWGIVGFILTLIVILGRKFAAYQDLMVNYSKELEFYNHQLQLSEKMEMISSLAASVAHEVRNPLQVTRGFLQLVAEKTDDKNKEYMGIAIEELDRASLIITDFLTFAKPQLEETTELNISKELKSIEGIIVPLATLNGGGVFLNIPQDLHIRGNSSKLKQALINIIKNSIEAFREEGQIHIWAYGQSGEVFIHIKDNGEGIEPSKLAKLGEPYFSTKTKGTGLGLMVTFRIIEVMKGSIKFKSQKNLGTEVIIRFPAINHSPSK
ncbi:ATP-binding protein [Paenibacillus sp. SI8]|uniref:ATP-binding protein n=1 Tax=unclassified Paenibacillus TaxID=185978 RepID=UPI0034675FA5